MRVLVQRVHEARVEVEGETIGAIQSRSGSEIPGGLCLFAGVGSGDDEATAEAMARKVANLRIFTDDEGRMNRSALEIGAQVLCVSQFTLYADCRHGRRPSFTAAAPPELGRALFDKFVDALRAQGLPVETGRFGAMMNVHLVNAGPVTIWLDSEEVFA